MFSIGFMVCFAEVCQWVSTCECFRHLDEACASWICTHLRLILTLNIVAGYFTDCTSWVLVILWTITISKHVFRNPTISKNYIIFHMNTVALKICSLNVFGRFNFRPANSLLPKIVYNIWISSGETNFWILL